MKLKLASRRCAAWVFGCSALVLNGCGGSNDITPVPVVIDSGTPNTVSAWDAVATATINQSVSASGTPAERMPLQTADLASAGDGGMTAVPPFVAGTGPGQFRGPALAGRTLPFVRPFAVQSLSQFRAPGPP